MKFYRFIRLLIYCALLTLVLCLAQPQAKAQNIYSTGFETPLQRQGWFADNGVWQIGTPPATSGPGAAYAGTQCAGTAMSTGAAPSTSSRLISPNIDLSGYAGQQITLTFWQWFQWAFRGSGAVEVTTNGGSSWTDLSYYGGNQLESGMSAGWSLTSVDLSAYAGKQIQIGFQQNGGNNPAPGWYIDNVSIDKVTITQGLPFTTGFESVTSTNWQGWSVDNGIWQIGTPPVTSGPGAAYDGVNCAGTAMSLGAYPTT